MTASDARDAFPKHSPSDSPGETSPSEAPVTTAWHEPPRAELLERLGVDPAAGLSAAEAAARLARHGPNALHEEPPEPRWKRFAAQFADVVVWVLLVAAVVSGAMGEWVDTVAIALIVLVNAILGFVQEERAGRALAALMKLSSPRARVMRGGRVQVVPASEVVPGDVVEIEAGDYVPADARVDTAYSFSVAEASLTGESTPVEKSAAPDGLPADCALADRTNMLHMGTLATAGRARAVVVATGMETQLGRIAGLLARQKPEPTPLQRRLAELGRSLVYVCLAVVAVVFSLELAQELRHGTPLAQALAEVFMVAVSLAVAAVPEGLPAVVTVALALGLQRMVRRNAIIRRLPSVETLGSVTVICSDKTGTMTRNEMTVRAILAGGREYETTGVGYEPKADFHRVTRGPAGDAVRGGTLDPLAEPDLRLALEAGRVCNNAKLLWKDDPGRWEIVGDPTEGALVVAALAAGIEEEPEQVVLREIPFDSDRKRMAVVMRDRDGAIRMFVKGAPDVLLPLCRAERRAGRDEPLTPERAAEIQADNAALAGRALRVLGVAMRELPRDTSDADVAAAREEGLVFLGLVGMKDPARTEAMEAVARCVAAGIRPIMITGDHPITAEAIAREIGMFPEGARAASGRDLDGMDEATLSREVARVAVFARVTAEHKLRVVRALKARGEIVAMTGDGVNDAPAVKAADIGVAMGITGTDVTKEAADMVLADDNFASIVNAVEEGRCIRDNIRKFVHYLLSCNAGEVMLMLVAALMGLPVPLLAIQILWINLVTDGLPALALGVEKPEPDIMNRPPAPTDEAAIPRREGLTMVLHGMLVAAAALIGYVMTLGDSAFHLEKLDAATRELVVARARDVAFCTMAFGQLAFSFGCRSLRHTMPELGPFSNPMLLLAIAVSGALQVGAVTIGAPIFGITTSPLEDAAPIVALSLAPVTIVEIGKILGKALGRRGPGRG